jgi:type II secretory pathway component PulF
MSSLPHTFAYRAQGIDGQPLTGTIDAASADLARERLESLRLRVLELAPADDRGTSVRPLKGEDFLTFNQQLAHLTAAGMPLEHGLRLIAQDMRRGKVANTVRQIADELEKGVPLGEAFQKHANQFPPAYGHLIDAGVKTNILSGMLLNLGEHLRTLALLRAALWRALAYPLVVFVALCGIVAFLSGYLFPRFSDVYGMWGTQLPAITQFLIDHGRAIAFAFLALAALVVAALLVSRVLKATGRHGPLRDAVGLRLPLVGPVIGRSLVSRWCDAVRLGVVGGMDLPRAMRTAGDAVGSARIRADADRMAAKLESGQPIVAGESYDVLPATVPAAIELSTRHGGLPQTLGTLAHMYREQAQAKVGVIPAVLTPLLLTVLTCAIGLIILAMFLPFVTLINTISGGK